MVPTRAVYAPFALLLLAWLLVACGPKSVPVVRPPPGGQLGLRYQALPEGLVVTALTPGGGAEAAGLPVGALLVEVDGTSLVGRPPGTRTALAGPPGSTAALSWRPPLSDTVQHTQVVRGRLGFAAPPPPSSVAPSIRALRRAAADGSPRELDAAVDALVADDFGGRSPGRAIRAGLRAARGRSPAQARRLAARVAPHVGEDALALRLIAEVAADTVDARLLQAVVPRLLAARAPDLRLPDGTPVDLGGEAEARAAWIDALWRAGERGRAIEQARALLATRDLPAVRARVGMAPDPPPSAAFVVARPPAPPAALVLRDGQAFDLTDNEGEVVLLAFWATWCRPCLAELPELERMAEARPALRVVAVSVDTGPDAAAAIDETVAGLGLGLPVAHAPDVGRAYAVEALPSVRLVGRGGSVVHAARGHSAAGLARLEDAVDAALAGPVSAEAPIGSRRGQGRIHLDQWLPLEGVGDVAPAPGGVAVSSRGAAPFRFAPSLEMDVSQGGGGGPLTWAEGPVSGRRRGHWVRARDPDGAARWLLTLPSPLVAVQAAGDHVFVALEDALLVVDGSGRVVARRDGAVRSLAPAEGGGVWAAATDARLHLRFSEAAGLVVDTTDAPGIRRVGPGGATLSGAVREAVRGPFGPDGADRFVVATADGRVIGLDGAGRPALVLALPDEVRLAVAHGDEGGAHLAMALPGLGIGLATLALP